MIPENGKTYRIDYWYQTNEPEDKADFYKGLATCIDSGPYQEKDQYDNILYLFRCTDGQTALFAEEDIIEEVS